MTAKADSFAALRNDKQKGKRQIPPLRNDKQEGKGRFLRRGMTSKRAKADSSAAK
jgi:hypothetical protein